MLEEASLENLSDHAGQKRTKDHFRNNYQRAQNLTGRMAMCSWAACFFPGSAVSSGDGGEAGPQGQVRQAGLNKGSSWEPQQTLEPRKGQASGQARWVGAGLLTSFLTSLPCFLQHLHTLTVHFFQAYVLYFGERSETTHNQW